ncbi:Crp/Fnr family transcriptional regulator [Rhodopseudomonas palustris]|uniref:Transcriptional regulator, Crp/Fnr family n=1 Tax=Rhodopseudomonas palustris (strain DX-1) TaxID=652103 RepID=E6VDD5_RHOPX|nr:Crp/Fnr family transcriptional regulator [Rhodopseudomonas palustris]QDL95998.1 Crp/Fnr family transcriptional regulator [Rhodopseudomonas palustris]
MKDVHRVLIDKLREHSRLSADDVNAIRNLTFALRELDSGEDLIRQGETPKGAALVVDGIVGRYHLQRNGRRQFLSFHMVGDLPDSQGIFLERMDHSICAIGHAAMAIIPHREILRMFETRPGLGFAIWRETLVDAAIFREAITNNSARTMRARMAHLFCELFYRAEASKLTDGNSMRFPISLAHLGDTLGMAIATVNRTIATLRASKTMDFRHGVLTIRNWQGLAKIGEFDPGYLHLRRAPPR